MTFVLNHIMPYGIFSDNYKLQYLSVGWSVSRSVCLSVCPQQVLYKCYAVKSVPILFLLFKFRLLEHFAI